MKFIPVKTAALIVFLALLAGLLYYIALLPQNPRKQTNNALSLKPSATLSIENTKTDKNLPASASQQALQAGGKYYSEVLINTNGNKVTSVQLELSYDPKILTDVDIAKGNFFDSPIEFIKKLDEKNGRITFALGLDADSEGVSGKKIVATIYYSPLDPSKEVVTSLNFLPKTQVSANGISESALSGTFDGLVSIKAQATPTLTPRPTFEPVLSPTPISKNPNPTIEIPPPRYNQ